MDLLIDWENEGDRFSFDDSDRFEEDSLCSWISEPESLCNNWRGWRRQNGVGQVASSTTNVTWSTDVIIDDQTEFVKRQCNQDCSPPVQWMSSHRKEGEVTSLVELAAKATACHIPFELVEHFYPPIPEQLQLRIAFWSFPENEEDIRLYSCLANGSADEFQKGEHLFKAKAVRDALQIGFHLSATVVPTQTLAQAKNAFNVAVVFDRRRITSCNCTCNSTASWCAHVVALCLFRIHQASSVCLRAPVSESLSRLHRDQLQKFAQYLISELPQQILPTAQRLLDELLSSQQTAINTVCGAPDPTAGASASEQTTWCLDEATLHENIKKTLVKFCVPSPIVFSDVNYLSSTAPPAAAEWQSLLRPLRGREPEGMWNLLSIVREMFRRNDSNAISLLNILTEEVLSCEQILLWWFVTKISAVHTSGGGHGRGGQNITSSGQHAACSLCDEIVTLWRLAALNPSNSPIQREDLCGQLKEWHILTLDKARKARCNMAGTNNTLKKTDVEVFSGFKPAIEACQLDWVDHVIPGVTYVDFHRLLWHFNFNRAQETDCRHSSRTKGLTTSQVSSSLKSPDSVLISRRLPHKPQEYNHLETEPSSAQTDGAYSSSSEGFCESDRRDSTTRPQDSDSDLGDIDGAAASKPLPAKTSASSSSSRGRLPVYDNPALAAAAMAQGHGRDGRGHSPSRAGKSDSADVGSLSAGLQAVSLAAAAAPAAASIQVSAGPNLRRNDGPNWHPAAADEYQVYFYDTKARIPEGGQDKKKKTDEPNYFAGIKKMDNKQDILFARAEALHAHGHMREACRLAKQLAEEMLANPPDLSTEPQQPVTGKGKKKKSQSNISSFASTTLAKATFLCTVLLEEAECHHLAYRVGMFGLEMPRPPASSKALEVKLAYQESELMNLLKRIPLGLAELAIIRDRAEKLRDGTLKSRGEALLPLTLASFIFESLCQPVVPVNSYNTSRPPSRCVQIAGRTPADEKLGFEAAVAALGLKANVSEAEHPLLCEGTRRQRGDLAIAMLVHYKDNQVKLSKIMDKLLDKEVHHLYKAPSLATYLPNTSTAAMAKSTRSHQAAPSTSAQSVASPGEVSYSQRPCGASACDSDDSMRDDTPRSSSSTLVSSADTSHSKQLPSSQPDVNGRNWQKAVVSEEQRAQSLEYLNLEQKFNSGARPKTSFLSRYNSKDTDSSAVEEEGEGSADYKAWEIKFRCTNLKTFKKPSIGMAAIDSSAPETTSSDNSPTLVRRSWGKHQGPGSDSGSSGKSSDSLGSSSSGGKAAAIKLRDNESPPLSFSELRYNQQMLLYSRSSTPNIKGTRYKKTRNVPTVPNQPSEAQAHFMFELAKTVLTKAGGSSSTALFTQPNTNNNPPGPHRALHLCAFQIGLYALGLHNCVSPNWLSRTYSSHVSWITGQAMEIGSAAINILIDTWEGHLTPQEGASLADRASRGRDPNMVRAAADLALSCLPHAQALNPNEIQRALIQCKEQSQEKLERACLAVESAAKGGGVYPEVLFDVAKRWNELYEEAMQGPSGLQNAAHVEVDGQEVQALVPVVQNVIQAVESNSPPLVQLVPAQQAAVQSVVTTGVAVQGQGQLPPGALAVPPPLPYTIPPRAPSHSAMPHHPYIAPYSYVQQVPPNFAHHYSAPHIPLHTHNMHPSYMHSYPYQSQTAFTNVPNLQTTATLYHANVSHLPPPPPTAMQVAYPGSGNQLAAIVQGKFAPVQQLDTQLAGQGAIFIQQAPVTLHQQQQQQQHMQQQQQQQQQLQAGQQHEDGQQPQQPPPQQQPQENLNVANNTNNSVHINYLLAAYRVGMLAMETLARRVNDDRPQTKYARNPPYGEDVKWLLDIAMKLGASYLQQFCASAVNAVVSPFILHDIAVESAHYLARNNTSQISQQLRSPTLNSVVQKCLQMFTQCTHQRLHHIAIADYDEFASIVCSARNAFCMTQGGMVQFNELLQSLRRSKSCKKDLWQRIVNRLATGNI